MLVPPVDQRREETNRENAHGGGHFSDHSEERQHEAAGPAEDAANQQLLLLGQVHWLFRSLSARWWVIGLFASGSPCRYTEKIGSGLA